MRIRALQTCTVVLRPGSPPRQLRRLQEATVSDDFDLELYAKPRKLSGTSVYRGSGGPEVPALVEVIGEEIRAKKTRRGVRALRAGMDDQQRHKNTLSGLTLQA